MAIPVSQPTMLVAPPPATVLWFKAEEGVDCSDAQMSLMAADETLEACKDSCAMDSSCTSFVWSGNLILSCMSSNTVKLCTPGGAYDRYKPREKALIDAVDEPFCIDGSETIVSTYEACGMAHGLGKFAIGMRTASPEQLKCHAEVPCEDGKTPPVTAPATITWIFYKMKDIDADTPTLGPSPPPSPSMPPTSAPTHRDMEVFAENSGCEGPGGLGVGGGSHHVYGGSDTATPEECVEQCRIQSGAFECNFITFTEADTKMCYWHENCDSLVPGENGNTTYIVRTIVEEDDDDAMPIWLVVVLVLGAAAVGGGFVYAAQTGVFKGHYDASMAKLML